MKAEEESREHHLAQTEAGPEGGEEGNRGDGEAINEEDGEEGVHETKREDRNGQSANSEG